MHLGVESLQGCFSYLALMAVTETIQQLQEGGGFGENTHPILRFFERETTMEPLILKAAPVFFLLLIFFLWFWSWSFFPR